MSNDTNSLKKIIINYFISIFVIICIFVIVLLVLYYLTPNNYIIHKFDLNKYVYNKEVILDILPNKFEKLTTNEYLNLYLHSTTNINLIISNNFKSQNISLTPDEIIQIKYDSDLIITNYTNEKNKVIFSLYKSFNNSK